MKIMFVLAVAFVCVTCLGQQSMKATGDDAYLVYSVMLERMADEWPQPEDRPILIAADTVRGDLNLGDCVASVKGNASWIKSLVKEYENANRRSVRLEGARFRTTRSVEMMSQNEIARFKNRRKYATPRQMLKLLKLGPGIISFSAVAFSPDGKLALVYMDNWCGATCGSGDMFLLRKQAGKWEIDDNGPKCGFES